MFYLDAIEKSCDDHAHWHLYDAHVYDSGYHYLAGPLLGNASKRGSKPFVRDFSKHRWPKRLRDYCQILVNDSTRKACTRNTTSCKKKSYSGKKRRRRRRRGISDRRNVDGRGSQKQTQKETPTGDFIPAQKKKEKTVLDLAKKLCYQSKPPKCTFDNEFSKRAFLQLATHEEEEMSKEEQSLSWAERGIRLERGGIRYSKPAAAETSSSSTKKRGEEEDEKRRRRRRRPNKRRRRWRRRRRRRKKEGLRRRKRKKSCKSSIIIVPRVVGVHTKEHFSFVVFFFSLFFSIPKHHTRFVNRVSAPLSFCSSLRSILLQKRERRTRGVCVCVCALLLLPFRNGGQ